MKQDKGRCSNCGHVKEKHTIHFTNIKQKVCNVRNCKCKEFRAKLQEPKK